MIALKNAIKIIAYIFELWGFVRVLIILALIVFYTLFPDINRTLLNNILEFFALPTHSNNTFT